jgi:hypothetical protein
MGTFREEAGTVENCANLFPTDRRIARLRRSSPCEMRTAQDSLAQCKLPMLLKLLIPDS